MGLVEKYIEIEKAHDNLCEQLRNKIRFIHDNVGKDYRTCSRRTTTNCSKRNRYYNEEQLRQLKEIKKEKELEVKKREYERLMAQVQKLESEIGK